MRDSQGRLWEQTELFARATDPQTSWDAARSVANVRASQRTVLDLFTLFPEMTDEQLVAVAKEAGVRQTGSGLRTRRSELVRQGLLLDSGKRARIQTGRMAIVWAKR